MALDEIVLERQRFAKRFLGNHKCDESVVEIMMQCIQAAAHEAWYQGRVDYAHEYLPKILHNHPGPF